MGDKGRLDDESFDTGGGVAHLHPSVPVSPSRRKFIQDTVAMSLAAGSALALAGCGGGGDDAITVGDFRQGVASGDPLSDRVILWTRVTTDEAAPQVGWEIASDPAFASVVNSGTAPAGGDNTVKVDATGLKPGTVYFYRFSHGKQRSPVGRTKTLPVGGVSQIKLAVFSCANFPAGYFHAYADAANRNDLDAALHLGDFIYEYGAGVEAVIAEALGRDVNPSNELVTVTDYRKRYARYHDDGDLRDLRAAVPLIAVWDDHEFVNNIWANGATGHDPNTEGSFTARRAAAAQVYHEWMPTRLPDPANNLKIYRSFDFGSLFSLHMLDARVIAREQPVAPGEYLAGAANGANRQALGAEQTAWLAARMQASTATWQVLGQQVLMARMLLPLTIAQNFTEANINSYLAAKATPDAQRTPDQKFLVTQQSQPYALDAWDGYPAARETVLSMARSMDKNLVVLSGDSHNAWGSNLTDASGTSVGVEFGVTSVSSPGLELNQPRVSSDLLTSALPQIMPDVKYAQTNRRGFLVLTITPSQVRGDYLFADSTFTRSHTTSTEAALLTLPGAGNRTMLRA